jgi:hypothetical protein
MIQRCLSGVFALGLALAATAVHATPLTAQQQPVTVVERGYPDGKLEQFMISKAA